jgi:hypothetical protein
LICNIAKFVSKLARAAGLASCVELVIAALQALYTFGTQGKTSSSYLDTLETSGYGAVAAAFFFIISTLLRCFLDEDGVVGAANQNPD